jgi:hypothetical protein
MKSHLLLLLGAAMVVLAQNNQDAKKEPPPVTSLTAELDRMIAARKNPQELAQYVFDTQGCKNCHTIGHGGKLGYTEKGKQKAVGFEGCINMLTAMTVIVQVPEERRSTQQRQRAARFEEFGCTACHKLTPGRLDLTDVGAKLQHLHLGCVDVEKVTSSRNDLPHPPR